MRKRMCTWKCAWRSSSASCVVMRQTRVSVIRRQLHTLHRPKPNLRGDAAEQPRAGQVLVSFDAHIAEGVDEDHAKDVEDDAEHHRQVPAAAGGPCE